MEIITGNKFKKMCNHSFDEFGYNVIFEPSEGETLKIFVKIDYIHQFFKSKQNQPYILVTHNGDIPVGPECLQYMDDTNLILWYGQNINTTHKKLKSIPIGIANEKWAHGNEIELMDVIKEDNLKSKLVYVNFEITNFGRNDCLRELSKFNLFLEEKKPFKDYLRELSKSYFVISPEGNGIDCHKTWEALYLKTIPIVIKSINIDFYSEFPMIVLNDWSEFNLNNLTIDLYHEMIKDFDLNKINLKNFLRE